MIEFSKSPIDKSKSLIIVINHDIMWLDISVHNTLAVAVVQGLEHFINIEPNIIISKALVKCPEVDITCVYVLHDKGWSFSHWVSDNIDQINDINSTSQSLQNFDFTSNFGFLDWLQDLNNNSFVVQGVDALIDFRVLSSSNLFDDFVVFLGSKKNETMVSIAFHLFSKDIL